MNIYAMKVYRSYRKAGYVAGYSRKRLMRHLSRLSG